MLLSDSFKETACTFFIEVDSAFNSNERLQCPFPFKTFDVIKGKHTNGQCKVIERIYAPSLRIERKDVVKKMATVCLLCAQNLRKKERIKGVSRGEEAYLDRCKCLNAQQAEKGTLDITSVCK